MDTITYKIQSSIEFYRITAALNAMNIPHRAIQKGSTAFPSLNNAEHFGEIELSQEYEKDTIEIFHPKSSMTEQGFLNTKKETVEKKISTATILMALLIGYGVIITLIAFKYWHIDYVNKQSEKNFSFEWNSLNTILSRINKKNGQVVNEYIDKNFDLNFEESRTFSMNGQLIGVSFDDNEDGNYETTSYMDPSGNPTEFLFDYDEDGLYETMELIMETGDTLEFEDYDKNNYWKLVKK